MPFEQVAASSALRYSVLMATSVAREFDREGSDGVCGVCVSLGVLCVVQKRDEAKRPATQVQYPTPTRQSVLYDIRSIV